MIATGKARARPGRARQFRGFLSRWSSAAIATMLEWEERRRQRHALSLLSDAMLKDIGLSRADVEVELSKPFWRP